MNADDFVGGHSILALERFMDETRHMIICFFKENKKRSLHYLWFKA